MNLLRAMGKKKHSTPFILHRAAGSKHFFAGGLWPNVDSGPKKIMVIFHQFACLPNRWMRSSEEIPAKSFHSTKFPFCRMALTVECRIRLFLRLPTNECPAAAIVRPSPTLTLPITYFSSISIALPLCMSSKTEVASRPMCSRSTLIGEFAVENGKKE